MVFLISFYPSSKMLSCSIHTTLMGLLLYSVAASHIPLGSRITVVDDNSWISSNGDFAIGFFEHYDQSNQFSVGIRFDSNSIPVEKQTIVWIAGAEVVVGNFSYFHLTTDGELTLFDSSTSTVAWASKTAKQGVSYASLLDNGNLVLLNSKKEPVWQSFDTPSDTLLPGQSLNAPQILRASKKSAIATSSYYSLYMTNSGLQLKWERNVTYWRSGSTLLQKLNLHVVLNSTGALLIQDERSTTFWSAFADDHNDDVRFRFLRLDADGNLRLYSWDQDSETWRSAWQAIGNQCEVFATCGVHGVCAFNESGSHICRCPFSLTPDGVAKCLAPFTQSCGQTAMLTYEHTSLYGIYPPSDSIVETDLEQCKTLCSKNPLCTAVTFLNDGTTRCRIQTTRYINGYSDPSLVSVSFVKICSNPIAVMPNISQPRSYLLPTSYSRRSYKLAIACIFGAASGTLFVVLLAQLAIGLWLCRRTRSKRRSFRTTFPGLASAGFIAFTYTDIKEITGNFMYQIKPNLFKGTLENNHTVMVRQIHSNVDEKKFRSRVALVGGIYHNGLMKLEGYCFERPDHRFLVYEFHKNGTLERCLRDQNALRRSLIWRKRVGICLNVGRAICYLHTECREFISHGNLRCENVILNDKLEAKITEYGIREILGSSCSSGGPAEGDVKDFGRLVLDLVTGRENSEDLCEILYEKWVEGKVSSIVDERIEGKVEPDEVERMLRIAFWCLQDDERLRPSMREVVKVLEGALTVDPPPHPFALQQDSIEEEESVGDMED